MTEPLTPEPLTPVPPTPEPPRTQPPWWKRKWGIAGIVVGVLLVLGVIGNLTNPQPDASSASTAPSASIAVATSADSTGSPEASASVEPTTEPTSEPTTEPTAVPTATVVDPILEKTAGQGDKIVRFTAQEAPTVARITAAGGGNFGVVSYVGTEYNDLLVNVIGTYGGWVYVAPSVDRFEITSSGSWTVEVRPITTARSWLASEPIAGKGDAVLMLSGGASGITTIKNQGSGNFAVVAYTPEGEYLDLIVNEIGSYSGEVMLPAADPMVIEVSAVGGTWSMSAVSQ